MKEYKNLYFVGAGGIGMAALERYFLSKGKKVAGYDRTSTELTEALIKDGVDIVFDDDPALIPAEMRDKSNTLVVYTPAVPDSHRGLKYFRENGFDVVKRAAVLGEVTRGSKGLCFAGTHGKTTTSSMAAHILYSTPAARCNAFLGGVLRNYDSNFLLAPESPYSVIEADEFDRSFHHLTPYVAVITATDPDHLDIYGTEEAYLESFAHFTELIRPDGYLIVHKGLKLKPRPQAGVKVFEYSRDSGDFHAENIRHTEGQIIFDFVYPGGKIKDIELGVPVEINIENAIAALAATSLLPDFDPDAARKAIATFMGPKRRFEFYLKEPGLPVIIDDYAHHPDELKASIKSVKALYPTRELTVAFQPHLYSRTRDFAPEFAEALSLADKVILLDIYPAREEPIPGVTSKIIFDDIKCDKKQLIKKQDLIETIKNSNFDILLTAGAGDMVELLPEIVEVVKNRKH
ncbi:MAG: UDP-N-acetylmuramate--L-alanine ligase [Muribaculaceae bacterium]|nr:UDP-N-acetylmuramate--L-alanine ligase [Muribaculaceae bacterium]